MTKAQREKFIKKTFSGTEVGVLVERFEDQVKLVGEQHGDVVKKIDNLNISLSGKIENLDNKFNGLDNKLDDFIAETRANFKLVMEQLSRIEDDFLNLRKRIEKLDKDKISLKEFDWLKSKVLEIENRLEKYKKQQTALAAKV
ncbi:MAG: hypothetical protein QMD77_02635 [Patescibacteria group bacterium]|nr:hypothetical protein [Patescibacteria group bacterium]